MNQPKQPQLPIGYWLKQADNLINQRINAIQAANGVSRSDWQVLNMLHEVGTATQTTILATMQTFLDAPTLDTILARFVDHGWVERVSNADESSYQLSDAGKQQHSLILTSQKTVREQAMQGISEADYHTTVQVLQQIVANLQTE